MFWNPIYTLSSEFCRKGGRNLKVVGIRSEISDEILTKLETFSEFRRNIPTNFDRQKCPKDVFRRKCVSDEHRGRKYFRQISDECYPDETSRRFSVGSRTVGFAQSFVGICHEFPTKFFFSDDPFRRYFVGIGSFWRNTDEYI